MSGIMALALALALAQSQSVGHGLRLEPDNGDRCVLHK